LTWQKQKLGQGGLG